DLTSKVSGEEQGQRMWQGGEGLSSRRLSALSFTLLYLVKWVIYVRPDVVIGLTCDANKHAFKLTELFFWKNGT
ncbi:Os03g0339201, partial [Oryza sativa Japonica Group]